jgi:hypothetical protein
MNIENCIAVIQTLLAILAFLLAYDESKKWRHEIIGSNQIDLAKRLWKNTCSLYQEFMMTRLQVSRNRVHIQGDLRQSKFADPLRRCFAELNALQLETGLFFPKDQKEIENHIATLNEAFTIWLTGVKSYNREFTEDPNLDDPITQDVHKAIEGLKEISKKYMK